MEKIFLASLWVLLAGIIGGMLVEFYTLRFLKSSKCFNKEVNKFVQIKCHWNIIENYFFESLISAFIFGNYKNA